MLTIILPDGQLGQLSNATIWVAIAISIAVILAFYVLRSFGLYTMAKKRELKHAFIAFIPLVWIYTACKLIGQVKFLGSTFEKLAIIFCIIFSFAEVLNLFYQFIIWFPVVGNFLAGNELVINMVTDETLSKNFASGLQVILGNSSVYGGASFVDPYAKIGLYRDKLEVLLTVIYYVSMVFDLASIIIVISVYINLFRKYYPQHFILFAILSWMGIFAPLVFAVRKRNAVNYNDYLRERYNAWYANGNPYGGNVQNGAPQTPPPPFEEFADKDEIDANPFEEFDESSKSDKNDNDDFFN